MDEAPASGHDAARALAARIADADARLADLDAQLDRLRAARAADSADDEHDPEGVTLSTEWSRLSGLHDGALLERADLAAAQARVVAGEYGRCVDCGSDIPAERLAVRPMATRCVVCAERAGQ